MGMKNKEEALDLIRVGKEDSLSATAQIPGMKEEALDLITAEFADCDLNGKDESAATAAAAETATSEVIRMRKKEVLDLMRARRHMYEEAKPPAGMTDEGNKKRRKKVVRRMFPQAIIDFLMAKMSKPIDVIPDDVLARYHQRGRDILAISMAINKKIAEYDQAIINQYLELGFAVDETEVTDDEMEIN